MTHSVAHLQTRPPARTFIERCVFTARVHALHLDRARAVRSELVHLQSKLGKVNEHFRDQERFPPFHECEESKKDFKRLENAYFEK